MPQPHNLIFDQVIWLIWPILKHDASTSKHVFVGEAMEEPCHVTGLIRIHKREVVYILAGGKFPPVDHLTLQQVGQGTGPHLESKYFFS